MAQLDYGDDFSGPGGLSSDQMNAADGAPGEVAVVLVGEIDLFTVAQAHARLATVLDTGTSVVAIDLQQVSFIDSVGVMLLVNAHRELQRRGGRLNIPRASLPVRRVLKIMGLEPLFQLDDSRPPADGEH